MPFKKTKKAGKNFISSIEGDINDIGNKIDTFSSDPLGSLSNLFDRRIAGGLQDLLQGLTGVRTSNIPQISAEAQKIKERNREARAQTLNNIKGKASKFAMEGVDEKVSLIFPESFANERGERDSLASYIYFRCLPRAVKDEPYGSESEPLPQIFLYVPDTLIDNLAVSYAEADMGFTETVRAGLTGLTNGFGISFAEVVKFFQANTPGAAVFKQGTGQTTNPLKFQNFEGVPFRSFSYSFTLRPKNQKETNIIKEIIYSFKKAALPGTKGASSRIYTFPNEWQIRFEGAIKKHIDFPLNSVITGVDVDYAGGQPYSSLIDGAPSAVTLTVNFTETTTLTREKYDKEVSYKAGERVSNRTDIQSLVKESDAFANAQEEARKKAKAEGEE